MIVYARNERGQFAPRNKEKMVLIAVRIPQWMKDALEKQEDRAEFIRKAIAYQLNQ